MSEAEARRLTLSVRSSMKIWPVVSTPQTHPFPAGAEWLSAYWPCEIYCLNFGIAQDYKGQCNLRFDALTR